MFSVAARKEKKKKISFNISKKKKKKRPGLEPCGQQLLRYESKISQKIGSCVLMKAYFAWCWRILWTYNLEIEISIRASPVIPGSASASGIEKWPLSKMQMQTQAKLPLILHSRSSFYRALIPCQNFTILRSLVEILRCTDPSSKSYSFPCTSNPSDLGQLPK